MGTPEDCKHREDCGIFDCTCYTCQDYSQKVAPTVVGQVERGVRWISVDDRLPEFEEMVLFYDPDPGYITIYTMSEGEEEMIRDTFSHWMPLPEPPKSI